MAVRLPHLGQQWPRILGFDWDAGNREKCGKHGVSPAVIEAAFRRPIAIYRDLPHSPVEERFKAIGKTEADRSIVVVFTLRRRDNESLIRPISARYMHAKEIANYEEEAAKIGHR